MPELYRLRQIDDDSFEFRLTRDGELARQFVVRTPFYLSMWGFFITVAGIALVGGALLIAQTGGVSMIWAVGVGVGVISTPIIVSAIIHSIARTAIWSESQRKSVADRVPPPPSE
ncbi:hypothetical protein [Microbacterium sp.]|uniref:hypothetical protein n=1 Tax=Microbacterium sp. TaxID=51671 RepID=UPI003C15B718